jgi:hypothetical protein
VQVGILGPLEVTVDGASVEVGGARLRALLTRLAADPVEALWAERPPADRGNAVQTRVSRLRRTVPGARLVSAQGGCLAGSVGAEHGPLPGGEVDPGQRGGAPEARDQALCLECVGHDPTMSRPADSSRTSRW